MVTSPFYRNISVKSRESIAHLLIWVFLTIAITNNFVRSIYVYTIEVAHKDCTVKGVRHIYYHLLFLLLQALFFTRFLGFSAAALPHGLKAIFSLKRHVEIHGRFE